MTIEMGTREEINIGEARQVDRAQELRSDINWAKKRTLAVDSVQSGKLIGFLKKASIVLAGRTPEDKEDVVVVLPQISTNNPERAEEVRVASIAIQKEATHKAAKQRLISLEAAEEKLQRIDDGIEPQPEITFQETPGLVRRKDKTANVAREKFRERQQRKVVKIGPAAVTPKVWQAPAERKSKIRKRDIVMAGSIPFLAAACGRVDITQAPTATTIEVRPTTTEVARPTVSPEAVNFFNESAQRIVDEAFKGLGVHDVNMVGAGTLADPEGKEYALFTSILPDKNNATDLDFLLIGEVGTGNQIETIKGLVIDEEKVQGPILEFLAVSFNADTQTFTVEGPLIRTNTQTGDIEVFRNGTWKALSGPDETIDSIQKRLGPGVLAALALPTPTAEVQARPSYQLEDGTQMEKVEQGKFIDLFPGSEVFMSERGDVVIINKEQGVQLAGQRIETKYGSYTFLMADSAYQYIIRSLLDEKETNLDKEVALSFYPADWLANDEFKQGVLKVIEDLQRIKGFKEGEESLGGYLNLSESPYKEELTRIISTLLALKEREISLGSVNLANYQPKPKDFVMVTMKPGNAQTLASVLPEGLIDLSDPASMVIYTKADVGYPVIKAQNGVYFNAFFTSTIGGPLHGPFYEVVFYFVFGDYFVDFPWKFLMRDAGKVQGINVEFSHSPFFEGPFAPLFSNPDIYGHLTAFSSKRSPYKPPYTVDQNWEQQNWQRFGTSEVIEVDFEKFK